MINKILISKSKRKTLHKDKRTLGMNGENLQEVLLFCLDEKIEGTGIVEVELPNGEKGMIEVERTEEGYELPVKSSLLTQTGFVKFQLRILHDNEEIFKSEIIPLEVKDSINATATIPEEYPSWVDTLTNLKKDLEKAESERVSNENERISAEKTRQENFTEMQKKSEEAVSNIKDLTDKYNENDKQKTEAFNKNFEEKQKAINDNAEAKTTAFGENAEAQTKTFNTNSDDKLAEYNKNHTAKMKEFGDNYDTKTKTFDDNAADKQNEFDENASDKLAEYNQNAEELINKVEQVQAENEVLKAENKLIKEQIPSANASGNSIHIEDSSNLNFAWKIKGGYKQKTYSGNNKLDFKNFLKNANVTYTEQDGVFNLTDSGNLYNVPYKLNLKHNTTYTIYQNFQKQNSTNVRLTIVRSSNYETVVESYSTSEAESYRKKTFTTDENSDYYIRGDWSLLSFPLIYNEPILVEGTDAIPYEPYTGGVPSPNPEYPQEVETVKDSVEIDVVNKNIFDGNKAVEFWKNFGARVKFVENVFKAEIIHQSLFSKAFKLTNEIKKLTLSVGDIINDTGVNARVGLCTIKEDGTVSNRTAIYQNQTITKNANALYFDWSKVGAFTIKEIIVSVYENETKNDYVPHRSQTAIMPIQQEMLEGDYIADVEHHEWKNLILTGVEEVGSNFNSNGSIFFGTFISDKDTNNLEMVCSNYLYQPNKTWQQISNYGFCGQKGSNNVFIRDDRFTTKTDFLNYLKQQYEAGTPVTIYYKLATPLNLELTEEQKAVREQKLYTYKNITNISVSDELASIDVEYKKDLETEHNKLQNQIDEIKQLLSTTQTSALLLDNLQKDAESEVE